MTIVLTEVHFGFHVQVDDGAAEINEAIMERLLDLDDVDSVYSNMAT